MIRFSRSASSYAQSRALKNYPVGGIIHGFEVKRTLPVPEFKLTAVDLIHTQTGAQHLHIDRDDKNNTFSIAFKTNPPDSTGVPHILEHTTLCGSQKYPVRDPFFKMLNRSLSSFMNAMTGPDYTFFPFSTTNITDFKNLRDVYIDATLNPLLKSEDFYQEGWRLEHEDIEDAKSNIIFKGVVYNEMKGQVSNANYYFWNEFQTSIYPALNNSGGDPEKITDLYYGELIDFHKQNYHPSNAKTFTYGNFALNDTLKCLNEAFAGYGKRVKSDKVLRPINITKNIDVRVKGEVDPMLPSDRQLKTSITWVCGSPVDVYDTFLLKVLGSLLLEGHSSIFYRRLIESGLGLDFSVNTGVESAAAVNFLTIGVQGVRNLSEFRSVVKEAFQELQTCPFEHKKIEAIIEQLELNKKDQKSDFGLQLLYSVLPQWSNKVDPFDALQFDEVLMRFREDFAQHGDKLFQDLIKKYILDKPSFNFSMEGAEDFSKQLEMKEKERLHLKLKNLNEEDKRIIYERGLYLRDKQNAKEDLSCLPTLKLNDIPRVGDNYCLNSLNENTMCRLTETNGISYIRGKRSLNESIPLNLYPYLPLFADSLTSLGTSQQDYSEIEDDMKLHTGGVSAHIDVSSDPITCKPNLFLRFDGWSLNSKTDHVFSIWNKLLVETDFQKHSEKLKILIRSLAASNTATVAESGHAFARDYAGAHLSRTKAIHETLSGIEQIKFITNLNSLLDDEKVFQEQIVEKLVELKNYVIGSQNTNFFITTDSKDFANNISNSVSNFLKQLPVATSKNSINAELFPLLPLNKLTAGTIIDAPFQVNYAGSVLPGVAYTHKDGASLQVLANLLTFKYLHREVREKGGAYGGGAVYSALEGLLNFYSYRDPSPLRALSTFDNSANYVLKDANWTNSDLNEAKLTIFQHIDAPISRKSEGSTLFYSGVTDQMRQTRREQLLDVNISDVLRVSEQYLLNKTPVKAVIGPVNDKYSPSNWDLKNL